MTPSSLALVTLVLLSLFAGGLVLRGRRRPQSPPTDREESEENETGRVAIEDSIDLHFFAPRDIPSVVDEYLWEASKRGFTEVRLIHGIGKGVQRVRVQKVLQNHSVVASHQSDGLGSTLALLRSPAPRRPPAGSRNAVSRRRARR